MAADLAQACRVMESFDSIVYSVYPVDAGVDGQRLSSQDYRLAMGAHLLQASQDSSCVAAYLRDNGFVVNRGLDGLSEPELDGAFVKAQDVSVAAILRHMVKNKEVNLFDAQNAVSTLFPLLHERVAAARAQFYADCQDVNPHSFVAGLDGSRRLAARFL